MDSMRLSVLDSSFVLGNGVASAYPARRTGDESEWEESVSLLAISLLTGGVPGSIFMVGSEMVVPPPRPSNLAMRLKRRCGPLISPHGSHMLYDGPIDDLLICASNCSGVNINLRKGFWSVGEVSSASKT